MSKLERMDTVDESDKTVNDFPAVVGSATATTEAINYPDGGLRAWLIVFGVSVAIILFGLDNSSRIPGFLLRVFFLRICELLGGKLP
jgi:hypothetical protein